MFKQWIVLIALVPAAAEAEPFINTIPNFFTTPAASTLDDMILGRTCYSVQAAPDGLNCNPAFLAFEEKSQFRLNVYADEDVKDVVDAYKELSRDESELTTTEKLVRRDSPVVAQTQGKIWYQHEWWAVSFTPVRLGFASRIRGDSDPEMAAHFVKQTEIGLHAGLPVAFDPRLRLGLQTRYVGRQFARGNFLVGDVLMDPEIIPLDKHEALNIEPGLVYEFEDDSWRPSVSLMVTNMEIFRRGSVDGDSDPKGEIGFSSRPAFAGGRLTTATHITLGHELNDVTKRLRLGFRFDADLANFVMSLAQDEFGIGVTASAGPATLGFGYKTEEFGSDQKSSEPWDSFMAELGLKF